MKVEFPFKVTFRGNLIKKYRCFEIRSLNKMFTWGVGELRSEQQDSGWLRRCPLQILNCLSTTINIHISQNFFGSLYLFLSVLVRLVVLVLVTTSAYCN